MKQARFWIGTGLSLAFLALAFRGSSLSQVSRILSQADFGWAVLAAVGVLLAAVAKAGRWWLLFFPHQRAIRYRKMLSTILIGQMVNNLLPARLGEVARIYLIGETEPVSRARALGTIALEKLIDLLMVPMMLAGLVFVIPFPDWVQAPGIQAMLIAGGMTVAVLVGLTQRRRVVRFAARGLDWLSGGRSQSIVRQLELTLSGLEVLRHPGITLLLIGGSVGIWILSATVNYLVFLALGLQLPFTAALFLLVVLQLGMAVPSAPGKLGIFHYLCILGLGVFDVGRGTALGYALLLHAVVLIPISIAGAVGLWWENVSVRRLQATALESEL